MAVIFSTDLFGIFVKSCVISVFFSINPDGKDDVLKQRSVCGVDFQYGIGIAINK